MPPPRPRILYEDRELRVLHRAAASDFTLVTFSDFTFDAPRLDFWGREAVEKLGIDAVGLVAKRENWFPEASVAAAAEAVRAVLKPRSLAYGYSMGAYGALKHGARLGVQASLAISPQVSIAPADTPWDRRFHRFHNPALHPAMLVREHDLPPFVALVADPHDRVDWAHACHVAPFAPAHIIRAPFLGHAALWLLVGSEPLGAMLGHVLAADAAGLRAAWRQRRAESGHWFRLVGRAAYRRGHGRLAEALWARGQQIGMPGATIGAERADALGDRIEVLVARGLRDEAVAQCRTLESLAPRAPGLVARAAHLLLAAGAAPEAEAAFRRAIALKADSPDVHFGLSLALSNQGRHAEALEAARAGTAAHPDDIDLPTHLGHLLNAGTEAERAEAETVFRAVLARHPAVGRALFGLSSVLAWRGEKRQALALAERAVLRLPGNAEALAWLGRLVLDTGNPERAERVFRRALRIGPARADGFLGLADAMHANGRRAEALAILGRGLARFPGEPALLARRAELNLPEPAPEPPPRPRPRKPWWHRLIRRTQAASDPPRDP